MEFKEISVRVRRVGRNQIVIGKTRIIFSEDLYTRFISGRGTHIRLAVTTDGRFIRFTPANSGLKIGKINKSSPCQSISASSLWAEYRQEPQCTSAVSWQNNALIAELDHALEEKTQ